MDHVPSGSLTALVALSWLVASTAGAQQVPPVVAASAVAAGNPYRAPPFDTRSLHELDVVEKVPSYLQDLVDANASYIGSVAPVAMTAPQARAALRALYRGKSGEAFIGAARSSPYAKRAGGLATAAAAFFAKGHAEAALACLVARAELDPDDPAATLDLAAGALAVGKPNEALALLGDLPADETRLPEGAWGLPGGTYARYLRGNAHAQRGEIERAYPLVRAAYEAAPELAEAGRLLALLELRRGGDPRKPLLQSAMRFPGRMVVQGQSHDTEQEAVAILDPFREGDAIAPELDDQLDLSLGQPATLVEFSRPHSADEFRAAFASYSEALPTYTNAIVASKDEAYNTAGGYGHGAAPSRYSQGQFNLWARVVDPYGSIAALDQATREREYLARQLELLTQQLEEDTLESQLAIVERWRPVWEQEGHPTDGEQAARNAEMRDVLQAALDKASPLLDRYLRAVERQHALHSAAMYGAMRHLGPAPLRSALEANARAVRLEAEFQRLHAVGELGRIGQLYDASLVPARPRAPGKDGRGPECHDNDGKDALGFGLGVLGVSFNCTSISLEAEFPAIEPLVGLSGELTLDTKGTVTAFVGPKGKIGGASVKGGVYVTAGSEGIVDAGVKSVASTSSSIGPVSVSHTVGEASVSFIPGPSPPG